MFTSVFATAATKLGRQAMGRFAIGIDIGSRSIKAVQVEQGFGGVSTIVAATSRPRAAPGPMTADETRALAETIRTSGFVGRTVVLSAPPADAMVGTIDLPPRSSNAPLDQLARMEMARNFRCAPDSFELAWWELPSGSRTSRGTHAMGAAVPHAKADVILDLFEAARFDIAALDLEPAALVRACSAALVPGGVTAILDLGLGPATLTLVYQGVVTFSRKLTEIAAGPLRDELCRRLAIETDVADFLLAEVGVQSGAAALRSGDAEITELPDEGRRLLAGFVDSMAKELALSFDYASHLYPDAPVAKLILAGGGASLAGLSERLKTLLAVDVVRASPSELVACDPALLWQCASPAMTLALGLALREAA